MSQLPLNWDGELFLSQGWAHYRGLVGDSDTHAHFATQLVFCAHGTVRAKIGAKTHESNRLIIPSNVPHMLEPSKQSLDLLYIEPTLLPDNEKQSQELDDWLNVLKKAYPRVEDLRLARALNAINQLLDEKVSLAVVAEKAAVSKSTLANLLRSNLGMPLRRYILWRRLYVAALSITGGADATTAAHRAGFSDSAHFSRTMKQTFGVSPSQSLLKIKMAVYSKESQDLFA